MTIKQGEALKAYLSIQDLNKQKLSSGKLAKQIYDLFRKLKAAYDFQVQEEQKIFSSHSDFDPTIGGISLEGKNDDEKNTAFKEIEMINKNLKELADIDFELGDFKPFEIDLEQNPKIEVSGEDIGNLNL